MQLYGPPEAGIELCSTVGELEIEYAAIRKGAGLLDEPHRATLEVGGADRLEFLGRMITQKVIDLAPGEVRRSFWLNRKGRIDADMRLVAQEDRLLIDLDAHAAGRSVEALSEFIFAEDVEIRDATASWHRLSLHGPRAAELLAALAEGDDARAIASLQPDRAVEVALAGHAAIVDRFDATADCGLHVLASPEAAAEVHARLAGPLAEWHGGAGPGRDGGNRPARPIGWHAFNIARIEGGTPLYNIDFGPNSLPHETGVLYDRVDFRKGCYLGQEVVARMESRGHSKQTLVALRLDSLAGEGGLPRQPVTGSYVFAEANAEGKPVGIVTSATLSPMLASSPVCFAMVRPGHREPGARLHVIAEGELVAATVQESLRFWSR